MIRKQIVTFLISKGHLPPTQHRFRGGRSCLSALLCVFDSPVISGVPQGTVLGPLLFIIIMCDINSGITSSSIVSFADYTILWYF